MRWLRALVVLFALMFLAQSTVMADDRPQVTLDSGFTFGNTGGYPSSGAFSAIDDQPVFFNDGGTFYFIKSSPSDSHGMNTIWTGTSMDDLTYAGNFNIYGESNIWLGGGGWIDTSTDTWYVIGLQEYEYDSVVNNPQLTDGGGKTYFHRFFLFTSTDHGKDWYSQGEILTDAHPYAWPWYSTWQAQDWGNGPHTLYVDTKSGYFYLYYGVGWRDWGKMPGQENTGQDVRYDYGAVARCPIADKMAPGSWEKWYNGSWSQPGLGGLQSSITPNTDTVGITWNSYLNKYVMIGSWESEIGQADADRHLWISTATDLTKQNWTKPVFFDQNGGGWYFWMANQNGTDTYTTGQNMRFYYGNQDYYQNVTVDPNGTYTNYTVDQRLPRYVVPEEAWNGLTSDPNRAEGGTASDGGVANPSGQGPAQAFDNDVTTKWLVYNPTGYLQYTFPNNNAYAITTYSVTSGNDVPGRDPTAWQFQGSNDGVNWTTLDTESNVSFQYRQQTLVFNLVNRTAYTNYRLNVTANNGDPYLQLSELQLFDGGGANMATGGTSSDGGVTNPTGQGPDQAFDSNANTKWLVYSPTGYLQYTFPYSEAYTVTGYSITSGNDMPSRDPENWTLQGSNDGTNWTTLDTQTNVSFPLRQQTLKFNIANKTAFSTYRLNVTANHGDPYLQLSELQLFAGGATFDTANYPNPVGHQIWIQSTLNNNYVSAWSDTNNPLQARATTPGTWEKYNVVDDGNGYVSLQAYNGLYVSAWLNDPNTPLEARSSTINTWEEFKLVPVTGGTETAGGYVALQAAANGDYVTTSTDTNNPLQATGTSIGTAQTFLIYWGQNLALGTLSGASASSEESPAYPASSAVDGSQYSRWSSQYSDPQWITVNLGSSQTVDRVVLYWDPAYAKSFDIQTSTDGVNWTTQWSTTNGTGGEEVITFPAVTAQYVRMYGTQRATSWGYSIHEFEVYSN